MVTLFILVERYQMGLYFLAPLPIYCKFGIHNSSTGLERYPI
jgi:hypothetical protein